MLLLFERLRLAGHMKYWVLFNNSNPDPNPDPNSKFATKFVTATF